MKRAVVDTNLFVSALLGSSTNQTLYRAFRERRFMLILSTDLLAELAEVLTRPQLHLPPGEISELLRLIGQEAEIVRVMHHVNDCRDPKDNIVLESALTGRADAIVTGDKDLLDLHPYRGISILLSSSFIRLLEA